MRKYVLKGALVMVLAACSDDDGAADPGGSLDGGRGDAGMIDAAPQLDGAVPDGGGGDAGAGSPSILARASLATHTCSVERELLNYKPRSWGYAGHSLVSSGDVAWVARVEADATSPFNPGPPTFIVSKVDSAGQLGTAITIPVADAKLVSKPALVALDAGAFALLWQQSAAPQGTAGSSSKTLRYAAFDATGTMTTAPKTLLSESAEGIMSLHVARGTDGRLGVTWTNQQAGWTMQTQFALFDAAGQPVAAPRPLGARSLYSSELVATPSGYAVLYQTFDQTQQRSDVVFARFDASGAPVGTLQTLTAGSLLRRTNAVGTSRVALVHVGDEFLAAWSEGHVGNEDLAMPAGAYRVLRVARLSADGSVLSSALVRDKSDSIDEEEPLLTRFGDSVALLWGRATHIYICAGCVSDHPVELVLLDPKTLTPRSNVVKVDASFGGLLNKQVAVQGEVLLNTFELTFHVHSEPGLAAFRCRSTP
jgi:hypothetical protein